MKLIWRELYPGAFEWNEDSDRFTIEQTEKGEILLWDKTLFNPTEEMKPMKFPGVKAAMEYAEKLADKNG